MVTHCAEKTQDNLQCFNSFCSSSVKFPLLRWLPSHPSSPSSPGFSRSETLLSERSGSTQMSGCFVCAGLLFLSLLLTHKLGQVSPRPVQQDTEPDKQSQRHRRGINIFLLTLLTAIFARKRPLVHVDANNSVQTRAL